MIISAIWVLEQEAKWVCSNVLYCDEVDEDYFELMIFASTFGIVQSAAISMTPYYMIYQQADAFGEVAKDLKYAKKYPIRSKFWPRTIHNYAPKLRTFARKGGSRAIAVRIGARFIPYVGYALLAYDLWNVGKWIGHKTSS